MSVKTEDSRRAYNKIAYNYDQSKEGIYTRFHIEELSNWIDLKESDVVLDIACGNGTLLNRLARKEAIQAYGIDISENMIQAAKSRYPDLNFKVSPNLPLKWPDQSVDVITVCCAFHHFEKPQAFISECKRILKRGGRIYIAEPNFGSVLRFFANHFWFHMTKSGDVRVYSIPQLRNLFCETGFKEIESYRKDKGIFLRAQKA